PWSRRLSIMTLLLQTPLSPALPTVLTYSYEWMSLDGIWTTFANDTGDSSSIDMATYVGSGVEQGQTIACSVTVNDGLEDGSSADSLTFL
ncbi:MAG: hypothetical protein HN348_13750, partial [Proteobacteria bacterium]|nr:hypothetical protein [Pseudomonadota bacterium]